MRKWIEVNSRCAMCSGCGHTVIRPEDEPLTKIGSVKIFAPKLAECPNCHEQMEVRTQSDAESCVVCGDPVPEGRIMCGKHGTDE